MGETTDRLSKVCGRIRRIIQNLGGSVLEVMMQNRLPSLVSYLLSAILVLSFTGATVLAEQPRQKSESAQAEPPEHWNIQIENWTKPQPGWLYILDPKPDTNSSGGRVWLLDPDSSKAMGSIRTGDHADFALSPDGSRLYVASSTEGDSGELAVIDTAEGVILKSGSVGGRAVSEAFRHFRPWPYPAMGWLCES